MSVNYFENKPSRLHSPLLDGNKKNITPKGQTLKGKKTYYNPTIEIKNKSTLDETLDLTLFNNKEQLPIITEEEIINQKSMSILEIAFKVGNIFILAIGGIFCLLEFSNIIRTAISGSTTFGGSLATFTLAFIGIIIGTVICQGFIHLIKVTKYVHLNIVHLKKKFDKV